MKNKIAILIAATGLLLAAVVLFWSLPQSPGAKDPAESPDTTQADVPSMPIDAALLQSGEE